MRGGEKRGTSLTTSNEQGKQFGSGRVIGQVPRSLVEAVDDKDLIGVMEDHF